MQNSDFTFDSAFKKKYSSLQEPSLSYGSPSDYAAMQATIPDANSTEDVGKSLAGGGKSGGSAGTPEMMAAGAVLQILGQYLDAPYKEMAAKQAMEMQRRDKQDAALKNLQGISQLYGRL